MIRVLAPLAVLIGLAACGAPGAPEAPAGAVEDTAPRIEVSGTAEIGIGGTF
ncbi:argininosuccinate lyase [Palleronia sediminis]|uniref:Argininosuccinate lyase n=1 Tax=Palleronia sediminis TaxID=2547833 RepID=A0A4R6A5L6_9RHOB|nr:argininosuccinate lyase [Palleronia sediminis]TDL76063.1 argininosuccinate lyase [Palleronia sediminis]